jgi:hypothetical protein
MAPDPEDTFMATGQVSRPELLKAVQQLGPEEFEAFLEQALALRKSSNPAVLSATESRLLERINRGIPDEVSRRYAELARKRKRRALTADEHRELLALTHEVETRDADRAAALVRLAKARRVPVRTLIKTLGIRPAPVRG